MREVIFILLGITMYEMLTGKVPFDGDNTVNIALQHIQNNVPDIRSIIPEMPVSISKIVLNVHRINKTEDILKYHHL